MYPKQLLVESSSDGRGLFIRFVVPYLSGRQKNWLSEIDKVSNL
jgi:hypothetical protein